jgi:hypothetical protein
MALPSLLACHKLCALLWLCQVTSLEHFNQGEKLRSGADPRANLEKIMTGQSVALYLVVSIYPVIVRKYIDDPYFQNHFFSS